MTQSNTTTQMNILGIVMAKSGSMRTPDKNIAEICGRPTLSYAIESLRASGVCNRIIVSTDSEAYAKLAMANDADDVVMRDSWSDKFAEFSVTADEARKKYELQRGTTFDAVVVSGGNVIFLRPSWILAAMTIMRDYVYNLMPIDVVGMEPYHWNVNVCRVRRGIMLHPHFFVFKHMGMLIEIDWSHELHLAREVAASIESGAIDYPIYETIHQQLLENKDQAPNRMRGLMLRAPLIDV